jgi:hypothetical protein
MGLSDGIKHGPSACPCLAQHAMAFVSGFTWDPILVFLYWFGDQVSWQKQSLAPNEC